MLLTSCRRETRSHPTGLVCFEGRARRARLTVVLLAIAMVAISACSKASDSSSLRNSAAAADPTIDEVTIWFPKIIETIEPCDSASRLTRDAVYAFASTGLGANSDPALIATAGNAYEQCDSSATPVIHPAELTDVPSTMVPLVQIATRWLDAMAAANRTTLLAAAGNLDNRVLVSSAIDLQTDADAVNDEFDRAVAQIAEALGLEIPDDQHLVRWDPPEYA